MNYRTMVSTVLITLALALAATGARAQEVSSTASDLDNGKMWLFENPPVDYLEATYGFRPSAEWFERARMSALRIPGCSASFVSPNGLVVTNHHCIRGRLPAIQQEGETLLDDGFVAKDLADERRIPGYYADQLLRIEDVTPEVENAEAAVTDDAARGEARAAAIRAIQSRLSADRAAGDSLVVEVVPLYQGGRYSAYVFRRFIDVRFVTAVELQAGFFGGDGDNYTYPRYALDYSFLRVYGADGKPMATPWHFTFSDAGVKEGDLVFVIGNPGSTSRQLTVAQLEYLRDVLVAVRSRFLTSRLNAYREFYAADPVTGEKMDLRNVMFGISNSEKAFVGRLEALREPWVIARRADDERKFREAIAANPALQAQFGGLHDQIAAIAAEQRTHAANIGAFEGIGTARNSSAFEQRLVQAWTWLQNSAAGGNAEGAQRTKDRLLQSTDYPVALETALWDLRLEDWRRYLSPDDPLLRLVTGLPSASVLATAAGTKAAIESGTLTMDDPGMRLAAELMPRVQAFTAAMAGLGTRLGALQREVGKARFAVYGVGVPPDATFSPRITDGVVRGYEYNGTLAPPYTTLYGMYDRHNAFGDHPDWDLPERFEPPPPGLDLGTPLNFVSTSDTIGGNSGSPAVTRDLALVGLNFDRNIEGLVRDYMYIPERGRNVMVDMRAVKATLDWVYDADRVVLELTTGRLVATEAEADR